MYRFIYITVFFLVIALPLKAQENLVPNGSFEEYNNCPNGPSKINYAPPWIYPTTGTSDYFNSCANLTNPSVGVPSNSLGFQYAHSGNAYSGLFPASGTYKEYIQVELVKPLVKGKVYNISYFVSLADTVAVSLYSVDMHISISPPFSNNFFVLPYQPQIKNKIGNYFNWNDWTEVQGEYMAQGGEKFITIGNFNDTSNTDTIKLTNNILYNQSVSYVYIDDVSITEIICEPMLPNVFTPNNDEVNDVWQTELCLDDDEKVNIVIYNRWGQKVYEAVNKAAFWDGRTTAGNEVSEGTYYYIITTKKETYKGTMQLLR